jgi:hypothetical protein
VIKERGGGSGPARGCWAGIGSGPVEVRLGCGLEKGKGREREFGEVFLLNFFFKPLFFFKKILLQTFKTSKLLSN